MKNTIKLAIFTFILSLSANFAFAQTPTNAEDWFKLGNQELTQKKYLDAVNSYTQCIALAKNAAACYLNRGNSYDNLEKYREAIGDFSKAIELNPKYASAYKNRGNIYYKTKKYPEAINDYSASINLKPDEAGVYSSRGNAYRLIGKPQEAVSDYTKSIQLNPNDGYIFYNRGNSYFRLGKYQEAINDHSKAIQLKPDLVDAYYQRANAFVSLNKLQDAVNDFSTVIKLKPDFADVYEYRGTAYKNLKKYNEAISDFTKYIQLKPQAIFGYLKRGDAYFESGKYQEAVKDYTILIEMDLDLTNSVYVNRAKAYCKSGQLNLAKSDEQKAAQLGFKIENPCTAKTNQNSGNSNQETNSSTDLSNMSSLQLVTMASSAMKSCQFQEAVNSLTVLIQKNPNDLLHYLSRAEAYGYVDISRAKADLKKASQLLSEAKLPLGDANLITGKIKALDVGFSLVPASENKKARPKTCPAEKNQNSGNSNDLKTKLGSVGLFGQDSPDLSTKTVNSRQPTEAELKTSNEKGKTFARNLDSLIQGKSKEEANKIIRAKVGELMKTDFYAGYTALILVKVDDYQKLENFKSFDTDTRIAMVKIQKFDSANWQFINKGKPKPLYPNDVPLPGTSWNSNAANNANKNPNLLFDSKDLGFPKLPSGVFAAKTANEWVELGINQTKEKNYQEAIKSYTKATDLDPKLARAYNNRGIAYSELKNYPQAISDYSKAIELDPNLVQAYQNRGISYGSLDKLDLAIGDFTKAIRLRPDSGIYFRLRSMGYCAQGLQHLALADEEQAVRFGEKIVTPCKANAGPSSGANKSTAVNCDCGDLSILGPSSAVVSGEIMTFSARLTGEKGASYKWEVDNGTIVSGQGTSEIRVSTKGLSDIIIVATVTSKSSCAACVKSASETGMVMVAPAAPKIDEFKYSTNEDLKLRLDAFTVELQNNNDETGYVVNFGNKTQVERIEKLIREYLGNKKFDLSRIVMINGGEDRTVIQFWLVPPGAAPDF